MKLWDEWQLRILVLFSLLIQFVLLLSPRVRRTRCRTIIWLAYIAGDAVAIYALATLFSRQKLQTTDAGVKATSLEVVWVPVLLIHLGGQPTISAYSLEDNDQWRRLVGTLVTKVAAAIYSFEQWWFEDVKLLVAAILLFILGIIKYATKPWALSNASFASVQAYSSLSSPRKKQGAVAEWWTWFTSMGLEWEWIQYNYKQAEAANRNSSREGRRQECESFGEYVQQASEAVKKDVQVQIRKRIMEEAVKEQDTSQQDIEAPDNNQGGLEYPDLIISPIKNKNMAAGEGDAPGAAGCDEGRQTLLSAFLQTNYFVDVIAPYSVRLSELQSFLELNPKQQTRQLKSYILAKSTAMYSNLRTVYSPLGLFLHKILFPCLAMSSLVLFICSRKDGYSAKDIMVTYILFGCTCLLELYHIMLTMKGIIFQRVLGVENRMPLIPGDVFQYNLLSYYARRKKPTLVMKLAILDFLRDIVNKRWYVDEVKTAMEIRGRVLRYVRFGWYRYIQGNAAQYKRFNNLRGQLVLKKHGQMASMGSSVKTRFDESVLLWHIATDLCFHCRDKPPQGAAEDTTSTPLLGEELQDIKVTRSISNYMIYLLLHQPDMLIPGARSALFSIAADSIDELLGRRDYSALNGEECIAQAIREATTIRQAATQIEEVTLVTRACKLAEELMELDEKKRWRVIHGMWIEMLCYSISRRRGYLQAKYLSDHADSLDLVWVLWAFMGMETWVERYHRLDHLE